VRHRAAHLIGVRQILCVTASETTMQSLRQETCQRASAVMGIACYGLRHKSGPRHLNDDPGISG